MEELSVVPVLPLRGLVAFPKMLIHFDVGRSMSIKALNRAMKQGELIFLTAQEDVTVDVPNTKELFATGTLAKIRQIMKLPNDSVRVLVEGIRRATITDAYNDDDCIMAKVLPTKDLEKKITIKKQQALLRIAKDKFDEYLSVREKVAEDIVLNALSSEKLGYLADHITQHISVSYKIKQNILEQMDEVLRIEEVINILTQEIQVIKLEDDIENKLKKKLDKNHREYYLREQIKVIRRELGEENAEETTQKYTKDIGKLKISNEDKEFLLKEAIKLEKMSVMSPEANVTRTYLDLVLSLPWNNKTKDKINIKTVEKTLNANHYGMEDVKNRILEFMAVRALKSDVKGGVICLVGPPGVGKTSIALSIAKSMGRKFERFSLGGVHDEADIRGHRKTYIASMPGRIINSIKTAGSKNPVILLDEIDKMGKDFRGDPASAMLEVFDPEQNSMFRDHYLEIPFDISEVLFITTANDLGAIPAPLRDRMEIIQLTSYTPEEKLQIAKKYLLPKQLKLNGIDKQHLVLSDKVLKYIILAYTRESGVRNLERQLGKLCRKAALIVANGEKAFIDYKNIENFLGTGHFNHKNHLQSDEVGAVNGLAYTSVGGEILRVEINVLEGSGKIEITGNLGDIMKESVKIAISYVRSIAREFEINPLFYKESDIHIHFPEGAVPKDGPSAGIAITSALISALTGIKVSHKVAMTGEVSLRGNVLAIGGLREKTMAAYTNGIKKVIIPKQNQSDLKDIPKVCLENLEFVLAENMDDVLSNALNFKNYKKIVPINVSAHSATLRQ